MIVDSESDCRLLPFGGRCRGVDAARCCQVGSLTASLITCWLNVLSSYLVVSVSPSDVGMVAAHSVAGGSAESNILFGLTLPVSSSRACQVYRASVTTDRSATSPIILQSHPQPPTPPTPEGIGIHLLYSNYFFVLDPLFPHVAFAMPRALTCRGVFSINQNTRLQCLASLRIYLILLRAITLSRQELVLSGSVRTTFMILSFQAVLYVKIYSFSIPPAIFL